MTEKDKKPQELKREITGLKGDVRMAERKSQNTKKTLDEAEAHRTAADAETEAQKAPQAKSGRQTQALKRKVERTNKVAEKLKKEPAGQEQKPGQPGARSNPPETATKGLKKEMPASTSKPGQPTQQAGGAATDMTAEKTDEAKVQSPNTDQINRKETSAMNAPTDTPTTEKPATDQLVNYEQAKTELRQQDRLKANQIISTYSAIGAGVGIIPVAAVDVAGLATVQLMMLSKLADTYKVKFSGNLGRTVISAVLGSLVPTSLKAGTIGLIRSVPFFGPLLGLATMPAYSWMVTYAIGTVFADIFEQNNDVNSMNTEDVKARVKKVMSSLAAKEAANAATTQAA